MQAQQHQHLSPPCSTSWRSRRLSPVVINDFIYKNDQLEYFLTLIVFINYLKHGIWSIFARICSDDTEQASEHNPTQICSLPVHIRSGRNTSLRRGPPSPGSRSAPTRTTRRQTDILKNQIVVFVGVIG